ncbi:hypothetical protein [Staphylococcus aureus]|uniref:hypothetical protein n=1 Tax=Staphylococcus aureus TaxID=1280 RepID=UPI000445DB32|nr:hypothetical protein [Staphylococcus aureus]ALS71491.1 hypothetical protein AUC49_02150 [Staphylococcus aureus]EGQ1479230.1 hypothetical protein [Staphylococcus aureus]EJN0116426.1 hypothetical protein [Staphylococcus aureus]EZT49531.1 hypothetical protein V056_02306 [Staphylococcus aureus MSSA-123]EZT73206.1 hypothetical protein V103_02766 [Staphylococcus aureus 22(2K81-5)]
MLYRKPMYKGVFKSDEIIGSNLKILSKKKLNNGEMVYVLIFTKSSSVCTFEYRTKKDISFIQMQGVSISKDVVFCPFGITEGSEYQLYGDEIVVKN